MSDEHPEFLSREIVDALHARSLKLFGGLQGVRDSGLVDSALASAENAWFYGSGDVFDVAAAYAFHLSQAQVFFDGNKRAAVAAALVFLSGNGIAIVNKYDDEIYDGLIAIAEHRIGKAELAALFRRLFG
ncbi:death-on-curing protein [Roseimicrobium gellanilyticum]|uniref:Death-on-curing protein n=1 Tax=Roseimicrobium gellanilyticum TaxID=748857 RepID=A0A366H6T4_9BACT|nr:type II toxin-antitoxin system death-on-curing family toxin [Roseimicrobium gellanilyticum]RBP37396.1 death-on-curing protein [Roseimicrobium gellanilyticum]